MQQTISFTLNGKPARVTVDDERMLWVQRYDLGPAQPIQEWLAGHHEQAAELGGEPSGNDFAKAPPEEASSQDQVSKKLVNPEPRAAGLPAFAAADKKLTLGSSDSVGSQASWLTTSKRLRLLRSC
jgi:hypothetical protein